MSANDDQPRLTGADRTLGDPRTEAARAILATIDARVFPESKEIPFYEQSVLIKRAVIRLLGGG